MPTITGQRPMSRGQLLTAELRRRFRIGTRTPRRRAGADLHQDMVDTIGYSATLPGYHTDRAEALLRPGWGAVQSYEKHIGGYRADPALVAHVGASSPWWFSEMLGQMADAGVTNTGEGERFFTAMARKIKL